MESLPGQAKRRELGAEDIATGARQQFEVGGPVTQLPGGRTADHDVLSMYENPPGFVIRFLSAAWEAQDLSRKMPALKNIFDGNALGVRITHRAGVEPAGRRRNE